MLGTFFWYAPFEDEAFPQQLGSHIARAILRLQATTGHGVLG